MWFDTLRRHAWSESMEVTTLDIISDASSAADDVLGLAFSFLCFSDLVAIQRVCRNWYNVVDQACSRHIHIHIKMSALACFSVSTSSLRRHVRSLSMAISLAPSDACIQQFQFLPTHIQLSIHAHCVEPWLLHLPNLTHLRVAQMYSDSLHIVSQLTSLRAFHIHNYFEWCDHELERMWPLRALQELSLQQTIVDNEMMYYIASLPALTSIEPRTLTTEAYRWLPHIPHLQRLTLDMRFFGTHWDHEPDGHLCPTYLRACHKLVHLTVHTLRLSGIYERLVFAAPRLQSLCLADCIVEKLDVVQHFTCLEKLSLIRCNDVQEDDIMRLGVWVPSLRELNIENCYSGLRSFKLKTRHIKRLHPPSTLLPHLVVFQYTHDNNHLQLSLMCFISFTIIAGLLTLTLCTI